MSEQKLGRVRTVKVIDLDGNESTTTLRTIGLAIHPPVEFQQVPVPVPVPAPVAEPV
jgi:hypothetical protein